MKASRRRESQRGGMHSLDDLPACHTQSDVVALMVDGYLTTTLIIGGILGNMYCLRILYRTSINTEMLVSLTALAVWDMILLMTSLFHHSLWATLHSLGFYPQPWDPYIVALGGLLECSHLASTWMLLHVSLTRFFAVSRPFKNFVVSYRKRGRRSYWRIIGGLVRIPLFLTIIACLITIPCAFEYNLMPCMLDNQEYFQREATKLLQSFSYFLFYRTVVLSLLKTFLPFIIITFLTVNTLRSMRQSMDKRATILKQQGQGHLFEADKDKTKSLQAISTLLLGKFLILRCWPTVIACARVLWKAEHSTFVAHVAEFLLLLNSATNSLVFVLLKSAFETRRLRRIRERQRELVAKHAEQVLCIGKALAGDNLFLISDAAQQLDDDDQSKLQISSLDSSDMNNSVQKLMN